MSARPAVALLLAVLVSSCGVAGPPGIKPVPADMHSDVVKPVDGAVLAAPAGWTPAPTLTTPIFAVPAPRLLAAMESVLLAQPETWLTVAYPEQEQAFFIVRSSVLNLPDIVVVQAVPAGNSASQAVIFSQSRYGGLPFLNANRARVRHVLDALTQLK